MKGTNIGFKNDDLPFDDVVQFDTTNRTELAELWFDFCKEEGIITYVEEVEVEE